VTLLLIMIRESTVPIQVPIFSHIIACNLCQVPKGTPESAKHGAMLSKKLAVLMETAEFPDFCFSYNLHLVCCR